MKPDRCLCENVRKGVPFTPDQCRLCWNFYHDQEYNTFWGGNGVIPVKEVQTVQVAPKRKCNCSSPKKQSVPR